MPLGEDFPVMLMISVIVVFLVIFLFYFIDQTQDRAEMIEMSEEAVNIDKVLVSILGHEQIINGSHLATFSKSYCSKISTLSLSTAYILEANITNSRTGDDWCFFKGDVEDASVCVRRTFDSLIDTYGVTDLARIDIRICK